MLANAKLAAFSFASCLVLQGVAPSVVSEYCQEPALETGALYEGEAKAWAIRGA